MFFFLNSTAKNAKFFAEFAKRDCIENEEYSISNVQKLQLAIKKVVGCLLSVIGLPSWLELSNLKTFQLSNFHQFIYNSNRHHGWNFQPTAHAMEKRTPRVRDCRGNPFVRVRTKDWNGKPDRQGTPKKSYSKFTLP